MGFFSRGPKMPEYVLRAGAWQSFAELMDNDWDEIAGSAWEGYQIGGRGFVMLDMALGGVA